MRQLIRQTRAASETDFDLTALEPYMTRLAVRRGETLFRKGDAADTMYLVVTGRVRLPETGIELGPGAEQFGSIWLISGVVEVVRCAREHTLDGSRSHRGGIDQPEHGMTEKKAAPGAASWSGRKQTGRNGLRRSPGPPQRHWAMV